jgi:hypothetical protein
VKPATTAYADSAVAVEKSRAQTAEALLLPLAGGTMAGAIAMGAHKITELTNGSAASDAAGFGQIPAVPPFSGYGLFGDGSDGAATITGTVTLTRDMQYTNLTVNGIIETAGFRVLVNGNLAGAGNIQTTQPANAIYSGASFNNAGTATRAAGIRCRAAWGETPGPAARPLTPGLRILARGNRWRWRCWF